MFEDRQRSKMSFLCWRRRQRLEEFEGLMETKTEQERKHNLTDNIFAQFIFQIHFFFWPFFSEFPYWVREIFINTSNALNEPNGSHNFVLYSQRGIIVEWDNMAVRRFTPNFRIRTVGKNIISVFSLQNRIQACTQMLITVSCLFGCGARGVVNYTSKAERWWEKRCKRNLNWIFFLNSKVSYIHSVPASVK